MASLLETSLCTSTVRRSSSSQSRSEPSTMVNGFKSLRHSLSRKDKSGPTESLAPPASSSHLQMNPSPSTRRPPSPPTVMNPFKSASEPPPPYSEASDPASASQSSPVQSSETTADDPYAFLCTFDTIFLIDDSGSMAGGRWRETADALKTITPICTAHDEDGIDIYFLNRADSDLHHGVKDVSKVEHIFSTVRPGGGTPTGQRLNQILKPYIQRYELSRETTKPINIICITDGEPSDDVESPLIWAAKKLDKLDAPAWQVGVQFFQVGRDEEARKHLASLDDELAEISGNDDLRDIVDTVPFKGEEGTTLSGYGILKCVLGSVHRKLDRRGAGLHS